jgi:hypothetical protein
MSSQPVPFQPTIPTAGSGFGQAGGTTSVPPQAVMPVPQKPVKKEIPSTPNKVIGAKVVLTYVGEDGATYEAVTTVDSDQYKVQSYALNVEEKHEKKRDPETKDIINFEDTGERILLFKMRYHVR